MAIPYNLLEPYRVLDGHLVFKDRRKTRDAQEGQVYLQYSSLPDAPDLTLRQFMAEADQVLQESPQGRAQLPEDFPQDAEDLVQQALDHYQIRLTRGGRSLSLMGKPSSLGEIRPLLAKYTEDFNRNIPILPDGKAAARPFKVPHIQATVESMLVEQEVEEYEDVRERLRHRPEAEEAAEQALGQLLDVLGVQAHRDLFAAAWAHWLWSVKRYLYGEPVVYHLMLSLYGGQGVGKSYLVRNHLCGPLSSFYSEAPLDAIVDPREVGKWAKNFVVNFEELATGKEDAKAGISQAVITTFKRLLTQDVLTVRELYSHRQVDQPRTFSAIATTNAQLSRRLGDSSGMRRFVEMEVQTPKGKTFKDLGADSIDWLALWQGIDEHRPEGYLHPEEAELWAELQALQAAYVPLDTLDHWLGNGDEVLRAPGEAEDGFTAVAVRDIYQDYKRFCIDHGYHPLQLIGFKERVQKKAGVLVDEPRPNRARVWSRNRKDGE